MFNLALVFQFKKKAKIFEANFILIIFFRYKKLVSQKLVSILKKEKKKYSNLKFYSTLDTSHRWEQFIKLKELYSAEQNCTWFKRDATDKL